MIRYFAAALSCPLLGCLLMAGCNSKPEPYETYKPELNPKVMSAPGPTIRGGESLPRETSNTGSGLGLDSPETRPALESGSSSTADTDTIKSLASPPGGSLADPARRSPETGNPSLVPKDHDPSTPSTIKNK